MLILGLIIGFIVGGAFGVAIMALMNAVSRESRLEEDRERSATEYESVAGGQ